MKALILITGCFLFTYLSIAQVKINRYPESHVSSNGIWGKKTLDKEIIIPGMDIDTVYRKWENEKVSKFAEPIDVDISFFEQGLWESVESFSIVRVKITAKKAHSIAVYFDQLSLSPKSELYIYNADGTVITGPITENENIHGNKMWGSNVFSGESLIIELKTPVSEAKSNILHIQKVLYGMNPKMKLPYSDKDSTKGPGFGLSSSCNINAICIAGWEQERRAIAQVVHSNGSWCSASLIMNTCNRNIPYILTANHCVVDINGNPINTSNSTFEFLWFSPTCTPTNNTTSTLFNGAIIKSRWAPSDFALLQLNQAIPQNSNITFLGWSRSTNLPNSSAGIHHPLGDIMKISVENSVATIGNIGAFVNSAWRVQWDQGTVQDGSSGSPLFDIASHRVIGQLFSNTQPENPPCNQPTGGSNYGRFDISWTGGGTNATRLSNWLDPNNLGNMTTNTTNANFLVNVNSSITGSETLCTTSGTYSVNTSLPVTWNITPSGIVSPTTGTGNSIVLNKITNGIITITATIAGPCPMVLTKPVTLGIVSIASSAIYAKRFGGSCYYDAAVNLTAPGTIVEFSFNNSTWTPGIKNGNTFTSGSGALLGPGYQMVYARTSNACGKSAVVSKNLYIPAPPGGCTMLVPPSPNGSRSAENRLSKNSDIIAENISVYPNPATDKLTVILPSISNSAFINIYNANGKLMRTERLNDAVNELDISAYGAGLYLVKISTEGVITKQVKIIKQ